MSKTKGNQMCVYDLTIPYESASNKLAVLRVLWDHCKAWCFQLEKGEQTNYMHWQCRISLGTKKYMNQVVDIFSELKAHVSITSATNRDNTFYTMKAETRLEGPYTDETDPKPANIYMKKKYRKKITWLPWQQTVINAIDQEPNERSINVIIDTRGNVGKSYLAIYLLCCGKIELIPTFFEQSHIVQAVMDMPTSTAYFLDLPRSIDKSKIGGLIAAIEQIKNGVVWDGRYHYKRKVFDDPHVWVFTNEIPDLKLLSRDRWVFWTISEDMTLEPFYPKGKNPDSRVIPLENPDEKIVPLTVTAGTSD